MAANRIISTKICTADEAVIPYGIQRSMEGTCIAAFGSDDDCIAFFEYVVHDNYIDVTRFGARDVDNANATEAFAILVSEVLECEKHMHIRIVFQTTNVHDPLPMHVMNVLFDQEFAAMLYMSLPNGGMVLIMSREPCESDHEE